VGREIITLHTIEEKMAVSQMRQNEQLLVQRVAKGPMMPKKEILSQSRCKGINSHRYEIVREESVATKPGKKKDGDSSNVYMAVVGKSRLKVKCQEE
jgi:hypothetical protein